MNEQDRNRRLTSLKIPPDSELTLDTLGQSVGINAQLL
jgi:hypothetical protein